MFLILSTVMSTNMRTLSVENMDGFLFGSVDKHVRIMQDFQFADAYKYNKFKEVGTAYTIELVKQLGLFWEVDDTYSIVYKLRPTIIPNNVFRVYLTDGTHKTKFVFAGQCVTYSGVLDRLVIKECDDNDDNQVFIPRCYQDGAIVDDEYLPTLLEKRVNLSSE